MTTPREALEKAYYEAIGPAFGPPEQLTEAYAARWEARRVRQAKSLTDTALTALAPFLRTPGTVEICRYSRCETKFRIMWQHCDNQRCPIKQVANDSISEVK
jgi:hypothetical protein